MSMVGSDCLEVGIVEEVMELEENKNVIKLDQITAGPSVSSDHFVFCNQKLPVIKIHLKNVYFV